ncbi:MAG: pyridine nucleotide-disulfide oxidoreductase [Mesorhizobium sp.]|uniref:FAD-dependent oxidoreductase n=1 Tax=Mesorhizobium sp. TaxID=1871066 RepID=UPI0012114EA1|nr:FAD-dependent oxidoreductase [Mesorhizobium sp.]TIQ38656.1 MAG: pyridine nucleotide-disulfide oxidoreductase [Mesorhizobium sp.]
MAAQKNPDMGPDLTVGVPVAAFGDKGLLAGHVGEEPVLLARVGEEVLAVAGKCTHYGGPLAEGMVVEDTVRCPWHHACFSLRTGEALAAPAFDPLQRWSVERRGDRLLVTGKVPADKEIAPSSQPDAAGQTGRIVIVGGGAAGFAAAEMLRRSRFAGEITMLSSDDDAPYDRPNLSKDYLAGTAPEAWIPLRGPKFYVRNKIDLQLRTTCERIDVDGRTVIAGDGRVFPFDRLLLATGAEPVRPPVAGADRDHVFTLRSLADSRAIIERARSSKTAVLIGAGFIGLEVAAALRKRDIAVHLVAPEAYPLGAVLGSELGGFIRSLHEEHGVVFHLGATAERITAQAVALSDGSVVDADLVVVGAGVKPRVSLAADAGIAVDRGVLVNEFLETNVAGIFAAGDVAQWLDPNTAESRRVEHWVVAQRQGQIAAQNMLGLRQPFSSVPFFWSEHYDVSIRYVGYARSWDAIEIDGSIPDRDCLVGYKKDGKIVAVAAIGRDVQALACEVSMA